ncbi:MAG: hypothetical protein NTV73_13110 [Hyphomicrobiales bacterium]|nr:hypothetical protein [Hyphomicrobiales bacterium]
MRARIKTAVLIGVTALGSGCVGDAFRRADGLTEGAGNTMAGNSVMQMVDPWQNGVQNTRLLVPAARASTEGAAQEAAGAKDTQTTSSSSGN